MIFLGVQALLSDLMKTHKGFAELMEGSGKSVLKNVVQGSNIRVGDGCRGANSVEAHNDRNQPRISGNDSTGSEEFA